MNEDITQCKSAAAASTTTTLGTEDHLKVSPGEPQKAHDRVTDLVNESVEEAAGSVTEETSESQTSPVQQSSGSRNTDSEQWPPNVCRYFVKGICRFGHLCHYSHNVGDNESTSARAATDETLNKINTTDPNSWVLAPIFVPKQYQQRPADEQTSPTEDGQIIQQLQPTTVLQPVILLQQPVFLPATTIVCPVTQLPNQIPQQHSQVSPPKQKSYAEIAGGGQQDGSGGSNKKQIHADQLICPYVKAADGICPLGEDCTYDHGELCDMCGRYCLHPNDKEQRKMHEQACIKQHEADMEISFAVARSKDKSCGICFEIIMEKQDEQRFGILPNCNHIYCLECIRKWRQARQFDAKITRSCPECRVASDYVCPSQYWYETKEEKEKLLLDYKSALDSKNCKYFRQGQGSCPFGNKCFYKHALPCGRRVDVGQPRRINRSSRSNDTEHDFLQQLFLWDFMNDRDQQWLDDLATFLSDSDDDTGDDWSDDDYDNIVIY